MFRLPIKIKQSHLVAIMMGSIAFLESILPIYAEEDRKPNIIFLIADDLKPLLTPYGSTEVKSPNFDRLAKQGTVFLNTSCQYPVCGPSRLSFLTGLRPQTTGRFENDQSQIWPPSVQNVPSLLGYFKKQGYYTLSIGKTYHEAFTTDLKSWSEPPYSFGTHNYLSLENIKKIDGIKNEHLSEDQARSKMLVASTEAEDLPDELYETGKHTAIALNKVQSLVRRTEPFFLVLGWGRPHFPFIAPKKYWDLYDRNKISVSGLGEILFPINETILQTNNFEPKGYADIPRNKPISVDNQKRMKHGYLACVSYIDAQLGLILDKLDELKIADQTIIVIIGDNGFHLGEHGLWGKFTHLDQAFEVPLIISTPHQGARGQKTSALTELVDIYPTLCELVKLPIPSHCEGTSLLPLFKDPTKKWKSATFSEFHYGNRWAMSMRTERYRYTEYIDQPEGKKSGSSLYDLQCDPDSNINIINDKSVRLEEIQKLFHGGWKMQKKQF